VSDNEAWRSDQGSTYVIRVRARLTPNDIDRLGSLVVVRVEHTDGCPISTLRGRLVDQSQLIGALNALHAWQMPVLAVSVVNGEETEA
jgi:hypothetical protein